MTHYGLSNIITTPEETEKYLQRVENATGPDFRFHPAIQRAQIAHCSGGTGPTVFGNGLTNAPCAGDPNRDVLSALERGVEDDIAPERLVATQYNNNLRTGTVVRTRPLCPHLQIARYNGSGDTNSEANFSCVASNYV